MGFHHVGKACLEPLTSGDPPASASQSAGITVVSTTPGLSCGLFPVPLAALSKNPCETKVRNGFPGDQEYALGLFLLLLLLLYFTQLSKFVSAPGKFKSFFCDLDLQIPQ